jgi:pimeloyl-ACP methyl ester carboxylesterase
VRKRNAVIAGVCVAGVVIGLAGVIIFRGFRDPGHKMVSKAGFVEKQVRIGEAMFNYAEGPDNGPPLLLLHAQHMDWFSYTRVMPRLSQSFHVYALDYHGHGKTAVSVDRMNANDMGEDLSLFISEVAGEPVFVSGNSSGGIMAAWLAANSPSLVRAVVLEDPSLFSSEYPRILDTVADKSFAICSRYVDLGEGKGGFAEYWAGAVSDFFVKQVGFDISPVLVSSINVYRKANPGEPVEIVFLPEIIRLMIRGMCYYDPAFGAGFHDGSWNQGFDHAEALERISCPALLLHANFEIEDGMLNGALSQEEADRIAALSGAEYRRVDAGHVIHLEKPDLFAETLEGFFLDA